MIKPILLLLLTLVIREATSQVIFCPPGAEWHYSFYRMAFASPTFLWQNEKIRYVKDTIINSENLKVLEHRHWYKRLANNDPPANPGRTYIKQKGDTVFFINATTGGWQILYNYAAQAGQSWQNTIAINPAWTTMPNGPLAITYTVTVDSVTTTVINSFSLRRLHARYIADIYNNPGFALVRNVDTVTIDERMGCSQFMFNFHNRRISNEYTEYFKGFLCYSDDALGTKQMDPGRACDYIDYTGVSEITYQGLGIQIFPNPAAEMFSISSEQEQALEECILNVADLCGRTIKQVVLKDHLSEVSVSDLEDGIYLLSLSRQGKVIYTTKLVRQQYQ